MLPAESRAGRPLDGIVTTLLRTSWASPTVRPDVKVQPSLDDLNVLPDIHATEENIRRVGHRDRAVSELVVVVFNAGGPVRREGPFEPAAHDPAKAIFQPLEAERIAGE